MTTARDAIISSVWAGSDPFAGFQASLYRTTEQGWRSGHEYLTEAVRELRPRVVVEIGVWNGASVRTLAATMRELELDGVVIAVDTWLGSAEHWMVDDWRSMLHLSQGRPQLQSVFMSNIIEWGLLPYVVPLPMDSLNAAEVLRGRGVRPDLIHLDGGHDFESVLADLRVWWDRLAPGGILIGDDYGIDIWPGVYRAFQTFFGDRGLLPIEHLEGKCRVRKPNPAS